MFGATGWMFILDYKEETVVRTKIPFICVIYALIITMSIYGCAQNNSLCGTWKAYKVVNLSGVEYTKDNLDFNELDMSADDLRWINSLISFGADGSTYLMRPSDNGNNDELCRVNGTYYLVEEDVINIVSSTDNDDVCHIDIIDNLLCFETGSGAKVYYTK